MKKLYELREDLINEKYDDKLSFLYKETEKPKQRYINAVDSFVKLFGKDREAAIFSAPGRTEIIGNHTDHQHGLCIAASVDLDIIAVASKNDDRIIRVKSEGFNIDILDVDDLDVNKNEYNKSIALIRGIVAKFKSLGYNVGGFDVYTISNVLKGSGLSSSAAFEVLIANIINDFYCENKEDYISLAKIGKYAENVYFGKPSGLLDQMASSAGGFVYMDFKDVENPVVKKIDFDLLKKDYSLFIIDTGGSHANLTDEYAKITIELKTVCEYFKKQYLRDVDENSFYLNLNELRKIANDRAILRAIHVFNENKRVSNLFDALMNDDFESFKELIKVSGNSSYKYLQNVYSIIDYKEQGLSLCLALCEEILGEEGAYRVHGGGFAGTVQAFVPNSKKEVFKKSIEDVFGPGKCFNVFIRPVGGFKL